MTTITKDMKRLLLCFAMTLAFCTINAENHDGKRPAYCNVMGYNFWGVGKVKVQLDLGRTSKSGYDSIYGPDGKKVKFNTMMEVLNYMGERGWSVKSTYCITKGKSDVIHYLLEKWVTSNEEITEGLTLKEENPEDVFIPGQKGDDVY